MLDDLLLIAAGAAGLAAVLLAIRAGRRSGRDRMLAGVGATVVLGVALGGAGLVALRPGPTATAAASTPEASATVEPMPVATWRPVVLRKGPGYARITRWRLADFPAALRTDPRRPAQAMPKHGEVASVVIPATRSHFAARPAIVYLPPAALVAQPRLLPVIIAFSGQSRGAGPRDLVWSADLRGLMDRIAARHHGVAPIVVVPDQLGPASGNPMCVDSRLGNSATYVMTDVRGWILAHLPVQTARREWTVAGFSQGGTCSIQFAAGFPSAFGAVVDVSGEETPFVRSEAATIDLGFHGSRTAWIHASPRWLLAHHRYRDLQAWFSAGARDRTYGPITPRVAGWARAAGMTTHVTRWPGLGHSWVTGASGLSWGFDHLAGWWGLDRIAEGVA
ncbi:alpha/beta hydrolase [Amnibacterium kyonggiense]|uniref:Enterochelin esterase-like enzyme n=1 Tax=Amnibacterium kyonggiense TaxID=595671 RepID=A0A4R7FLR0_9MICO|nr:alpha/beta hydrolase-fold protein [Amnibacterium kyonggiense]TDS77361.1 enterochelin esterase-like enzyme [Amnibacterium kyonggiense]